jgi:hypothetical protein
MFPISVPPKRRLCHGGRFREGGCVFTALVFYPVLLWSNEDRNGVEGKMTPLSMDQDTTSRFGQPRPVLRCIIRQVKKVRQPIRGARGRSGQCCGQSRGGFLASASKGQMPSIDSFSCHLAGGQPARQYFLRTNATTTATRCELVVCTPTTCPL